MARWLWPWSKYIKERACRYLLQRYLGQFLQETLSLDQLSLDLYKGNVALRDIHLETWSVNEVLESVESPLELVEGFVESIEVAVPWASLLTDHCMVNVKGLQLTLKPRQGSGSGAADSQNCGSSSMTTSLQMAQECLRDGSAEPSEPPQPLEGLEVFAQTLESVLQRIRVVFQDTVVRVECTPDGQEQGLALEVHVQRLEYCDEAGQDPSQEPPMDVRQPPAFLHKLLQLVGVRLFFMEISEEDPQGPLLQIGSFSGYIELTVKLKQNEAFPGPKLEVAGRLGSLHLLLTPLQLQQLLDLLQAINFTDPKGPRDKLSKGRPLGVEDMWLIEQDLNQQLQAGTEADSELESLDPLANLDSSDLFFSMPGLTSSVTSAISELSLSDVDLGSSVHSATAPRRPSAHTRPAGKAAPTPLPDTLRPDSLLKMTLGGILLTVPQTATPGSTPDLTTCFFAEFDATKEGPCDSHHLRGRFRKACPWSHIRLMGAAMQLSWELRTGARGQRTTSTDVCFGQLEVLECLWPQGAPEPEFTEVLSFPSVWGSQDSTQPCAHLRHTQTLRRVSKSRPRRQPTYYCHSELVLELADFQTDVELGALERLTTLLCQATSTQPDPEDSVGLMTEPQRALEQRTVVWLSAPRATLRLYFPIADLRPERDPWAGRAVRAEKLRLELSEPQFWSELSSGPGPPTSTRLELSCSDLHGTYEDGEKAPIHCLRVSKALDPRGPGHKYSLPQVVVTLNPWCCNTLLDLGLDREDLEATENPCQLPEPSPSPFSSKRTMYESEEMVIPGDPEEMRDFQRHTLSMSRCSVEVTLPSAHIFLPSKEFYERIYNRINNDLLMWEPAILIPPFDPFAYSTGFTSPFKKCKSAFKLGTGCHGGLGDSDSEDEDCPFFSAGASGGDRPRSSTPEPSDPHNQSGFTTLVTVLKGRVTALCESKGEDGQHLEAKHGELVLDVDHSTLFCVSQHLGQPGLGYFCLEAERAELYHAAAVDDYLLPTHLELPSVMPPAYLAPTIYPSEEGVTELGSLGPRDQGRTPPMLSTAVRIHLDPQKNVKEFLVTMRLHRATLRHRMALPGQSWYSQLLEFLDVLDEPVLGYLPPSVITVLHVHLFSCAMDYRPLYLPVRVLVTAETFTLSSNIIMDTATFLLRFILDDSALYLSDKCQMETLNLRRDYICVLDVDLLELEIKTWKGSTEGKLSQPLFELRCASNVVHMHSCADSCALLVNLLQYITREGDLHPPPRPPSPTEIAGQKLSESPASLPPGPPVETALINQGDLTDALLDSGRSPQELAQPSGRPLPQGSPVSVYLFPGERGSTQPSQQWARAFAGCLRPEEKDQQSEGDTQDSDEFCILEAPGMGILPRDGEPVVRQLHPGPIIIHDGHFSRPVGSTDLLRAPARFPVPSSRVVLREISLVWHLYGGRDFGPHHGRRLKANLSGPRSSPSRCSGPNRPQNSWRLQGGTGRQHNVLMEIQLSKVSFQHEVYPVEADPNLEEQPLSRQVFVVQELEVRDRLATSKINKFLYLYASERMPRRTHSNMLTIKALHVAPTASLEDPECCLRVSLMPLRLNVDQDALFFLKDFFSNVAAGINPMVPAESDQTAYPKVYVQPRSSQDGQPKAAGAENPQKASGSSRRNSYSEQQPIYFREFRFTSEVPIWLDYHGKHVTMDQVGTFAGLLIGLAQLNCSELKLKRLCCRQGLLGVDKVVGYAINEWLQDIRKNQLPGLLVGVGPMHSVVQLFQGFRDLLWLPIEQYRKDGRLIRGLQRGAASFGSSTASAALELSNRLVQAIQATAETVYDILSPTAPISRALQNKRSSRKLRKGQQPADLREGVVKAYDTVREGILDTAQTICDVASRGHEQKGLTGAVGGVIRQLPPTVVRPLILATEATSNLLGGMRNQILPDAHKDHTLKWRSEETQD
ncbi:PREDICTED: autophagy-related protein 2 homolog A [Elephantulus edwardii]|uniref:autophagy-related protein 2 homolog A n=1 Tax=Elephantulus edwardii TaxID=28737 RepID=UPI0003F0B083|nr:PREDICTED: autophagy-related protein 2 homolog A [Elephantulus edwardii]